MSKPASPFREVGHRRRVRSARPPRRGVPGVWIAVLAVVVVAFDAPWIAAIFRTGLSQGVGPFLSLLAFALVPVGMVGFLAGVHLARRQSKVTRPPYLRVIRPEGVPGKPRLPVSD